MTVEGELWALEERFWTEGADSARHMTAKDAVFVFPYPAGILQGDSLWRESDVAQRWRSVVMTERYFKQEKDVAVLAYRVSAERSSISAVLAPDPQSTSHWSARRQGKLPCDAVGGANSGGAHSSP